MNLNNKIFKDNRTGEVLKVIDSFENIAILENKTKIDAPKSGCKMAFFETIPRTAAASAANGTIGRSNK